MRPLAVVLAAVGAWAGHASGATLVGRWDFEDTLEPTVGTGSLVPADPPQYEHITINGVEVHSVSWVQGTPAGGDEQYFTVPNPIGGNGGGSFTNQYTVVMDVKFDAPGPTGGFTSLAQTAAEPNGNDGDWFLRGDGGMGISGDYTDAGNDVRFPYGEFVRVAWVVDTTTPAGGDGTVYRTYLNGELQNVVQSPSGWGVDGRYSLGDVFHVFADEDGETNSGEISTLMLFDGALSPQEVAGLGGPQATVPEPSGACVIAAAGALALRRRRGRASR